MKRVILSMLAIFSISKQIIGQSNLIPNPSFEDISDCPDGITAGQLELAIPWVNALSTPDLYNSCGLSTVPINSTNCYQPAHSGNGYAGIAPFYTIPRTTEYMEVKLKEKLIKGKRYFVRFYVSARNCSDPEICYSDAMGLAFSDTLYQEEVIVGAEQIPPFVPAIQNPAGNILKDTLNWMEISGCYTATGTEQYAIIGSFKTSANTQSDGCVGVTGSYYYIDDVGVYEFNPLPDTLVLCSGETRTIGKSFLNASYLWNTGIIDSTLTINEEGQYIVNIMIGNCTLSDTVIVFEIDKLLNSLPLDTLLCKGETLEISIPITGNYSWSNGEVSNQISITSAGTYSVSIQNDCGIFSHTFEVTSEVCDCNVYVPNAFSPNDDGNNDYLKCFIGCNFPYQSIRFQVFDRWGGLVYFSTSTDTQTIIWDGNFRGKALDTGIYVWVFEYEYTRNGIVLKKPLAEMSALLNNLFLLLTLCCCCITNGQKPVCGNEIFFTDGLSREKVNEADRIIENYLSHGYANSRSEITIPVVVHIVWYEYEENLSDALVLSQIDALNRDFNANNIDVQDAPNEFKTVIGNPHIRFCLAAIDPNGNLTTGVVRVQSEKSEIGLSDDVYFSANGGSDAWDTDKYLNIWVANTGNLISGFGTYPNWVVPEKTGVVIHPKYFGINNHQQYGLGRVATHEISHYLGLKHLWADDLDCNTDDEVSDTPHSKKPIRAVQTIHKAAALNESEMFIHEYQTKVKATKEFLENYPIVHDETLPHWNYVALPSY